MQVLQGVSQVSASAKGPRMLRQQMSAQARSCRTTPRALHFPAACARQYSVTAALTLTLSTISLRPLDLNDACNSLSFVLKVAFR